MKTNNHQNNKQRKQPYGYPITSKPNQFETLFNSIYEEFMWIVKNRATKEGSSKCPHKQ